MKVRADVAELLHHGHSDRAIVRQLHVDAKVVAAARAHLGIPKAKPGRKPAASAENLFWLRVKPTDDGHMDWTGSRNSTGVPSLRHGGRNLSAYRIAYRIANNREPEGYALPNCEHDGCTKPGHHTDRTDRAQEKRVDALYGAIFGAAS
ncbi:hypothetical protein ACIQAC_01395 [Streptomyces sp. NPDC088387]|uniref:hypothetical protein n=1 Tax=Streptomyces sp. NPDC088387 TaxID=3365859 RepID=UPI003811B734